MEKKDIYMGKIFGYDLNVVNVPEERLPHVEKLVKAHFERLKKLDEEAMFGLLKSELEVAKTI